jgi:C_GCAxxG_C_C family probable redox protein
MANEVETAVDLFRGGCACSQAVFGAFATRVGVDRNLALRLASGFAGGMRAGEVCGAVTGGILALSAAHSTDACVTAEQRQPVYTAVTALVGAFKVQHGGLSCRDLLGCDTSTPDGNQRARELGLFTSRCPELVRDAARMVDGLLPASAAPKA